MTAHFVLTCGSCNATHTLAGDAAVIAAEIATFVAAHRDHGEFQIQSDAASLDTDSAD